MTSRPDNGYLPDIQRGEIVLWVGQPCAAMPANVRPGGLIGVGIFGLFAMTVLGLPSRNPLWLGLLPLLLGLYVWSARKRALVLNAKRDNMLYVLTNRRVIRYSGPDQRYLHGTPLTEILDPSVEVGAHGTGTIYCRATGYGTWPTRNHKGRSRALFRNVGDVRMVFDLLVAALEQVTPAELTMADEFRIKAGREEQGTASGRWWSLSGEEGWKRVPDHHPGTKSPASP